MRHLEAFAPPSTSWLESRSATDVDFLIVGLVMGPKKRRIESGKTLVFKAQTKGRRERKRKGKEEEGKERGRERGKGKLEVKLWQTRKKSQTPQPGIEPGTPANAADALPLSHRDKRHHQLVCSKSGFDCPRSIPGWGVCNFFRFCRSFTSNFPFPLSLPLSFPSSSFPFLFLSLRPFVCALKSHSSHLSL